MTDRVYNVASGEELKLDVYRPRNAAAPVPEALGAFMERRYPRCAFVQDTSRRILLAEMATDAAAVAGRMDRIRDLPARMAEVDAVLSRPAW